MATSSVNSIQSSRISWQFLLLTGSICPICSGCFPLVSVVSPLVLLWCVFWVPSGPGANCLVSHLTVSCSTCITTFLTVICASPCLYPDMFNAWRIEKDCTIDYPAQRWIFLLRGRSHITSAAGGGRGGKLRANQCWRGRGERYPRFLIEWIYCWIESCQFQHFESNFELNILEIFEIK